MVAGFSPIFWRIGLIAVGGGAGSVLRYAVQGWLQRPGAGTFPIGTLCVNVVGCFVIGLLNAALAGPVLIREEYRLALTVGVLGGFTTFSSFGGETFSLANEGQMWRAAANLVLSVGLGFVAVWAGYRVSEKWLGI